MPIELIARGLIIHGSSVLLCKAKQGGYYYLPGGHIEKGESAPEAVRREILEETGLESTVGEFLLATELHFTQNGKRKHELTLVFHVEHLDGAPEPPAPVPSAEDHLEFLWVDLAAVQDLDVRPSVHQAWLAAGATDRGYLFHVEHPESA